jgi:biotin carboxyl carrier protein
MKEISLDINGKNYKVNIEKFGAHEAVLKVNDKTYKVGLKDLGIEKVAELKLQPTMPMQATPFMEPKAVLKSDEPTRSIKPASVANASSIISPLPGLIIKIAVKEGDAVKEGQLVLVMEAMKMENEIHATKDGVVKEIKVKQGDSVVENDILMVLG